MAVRIQEKKTSQRENQLERKVKSLEEELYKARAQLDKEYVAQGAKKAKVCHILLVARANFHAVILKSVCTDSGRTFIVGETEKVATNCGKIEREIERKNGRVRKIIFESRKASVGGFLYGERKMVFKEQIKNGKQYRS